MNLRRFSGKPEGRSGRTFSVLVSRFIVLPLLQTRSIRPHGFNPSPITVPMTFPPLRHQFSVGDRVRRMDGIEGQVVEITALYALIHWSDEMRTWVEQHDADVEITERAGRVAPAA